MIDDIHGYTLEPGESFVNLYPIGIMHKCTQCLDGEMRVFSKDGADPAVWNEELQRVMIIHKCTSCNIILQLPKNYPRVEWYPIHDRKILVGKGDIYHANKYCEEPGELPERGRVNSHETKIKIPINPNPTKDHSR